MSTTAALLPPPSSRDHVRARLRHGACATLRPLRHGEVDPVLEVFDGLSSESRASRYLVGLNRLSASTVTALADVDGHDHAAWLASVSGRPVGIARAIRVAAQTVELAVEVVDAWHREGVGTVLLDTVTTVAAAHGARRLRATVHPQNTASRHLLADFGLRPAFDGGLLEGEGPIRLLDPARVDRWAVLALADSVHP